MPPTERATFPHRRNPDGTFDSICTQCYATVASNRGEAELRAAEREHECKGFDLGRIMQGTNQERHSNRTRSTPCSIPKKHQSRYHRPGLGGLPFVCVCCHSASRRSIMPDTLSTILLPQLGCRNPRTYPVR
jgi:hypothetical protein